MSKETWIAEFYPIPADKVPAEDALDHSIRKWEGALAENLEKHGLEQPPVTFDSDSCALCLHYFSGTPECGRCPLFIVRENVRCDREGSHEKVSPFGQYMYGANPRPMLAWLKKAKEMK